MASIDSAARAYANRSVRIRRDHSRGMMTITVELPMNTCELIEKALDKARDDDVLQILDLANASWSTRQADAFVNMVNGYLSGGGEPSTNDNYLVTVHVDQAALADREGRSAFAYEIPPRGGLLSATENCASEPPPPVYWH